jgi:hypothetical protein
MKRASFKGFEFDLEKVSCITPLFVSHLRISIHDFVEFYFYVYLGSQLQNTIETIQEFNKRDLLYPIKIREEFNLEKIHYENGELIPFNEIITGKINVYIMKEYIEFKAEHQKLIYQWK